MLLSSSLSKALISMRTMKMLSKWLLAKGGWTLLGFWLSKVLISMLGMTWFFDGLQEKAT
ncbi:hypothetical protein D3C71_2192290 [compost metagenome]